MIKYFLIYSTTLYKRKNNLVNIIIWKPILILCKRTILLYHWCYKMTNKILSCMQLSALWFYFIESCCGEVCWWWLYKFLLDKWVHVNVELFSFTRSHRHQPSCERCFEPISQLERDIWVWELVEWHCESSDALPAPNDVDGPDIFGLAWTTNLPLRVFTTCNTIPLMLPKMVGRIYVVRKEPIASRLLYFFCYTTQSHQCSYDQVGSRNFAYLYCCGRDDETALHDCLHVTHVWLRLVLYNFITNLFSGACMNGFSSTLTSMGLKLLRIDVRQLSWLRVYFSWRVQINQLFIRKIYSDLITRFEWFRYAIKT